MNDSRGNSPAKLHTLPEVYVVSLPRGENGVKKQDPDDASDNQPDTLVLHAHVPGDPFSTVSLPKKRPLLWPKQSQ